MMVPLKVSVLSMKIATIYLEVSDGYIMPAQKYSTIFLGLLHSNLTLERSVKCSISIPTRHPRDKLNSSVSKPSRVVDNIEI